MTAGQLFEQGGRSDAEIARLLGVSAQAVRNWHHAWSESGPEALFGHGIADAQCALANLAALTLDELTHAVRTGLRGIQHRPALLTVFLAHTGLEIHPAPT
ncbi:helix-turn-helix domain-containing protein [Streptomyces sp. NPDC002742]|uniref:helix-turn-helix domain-containing protein n=1 Tax=Streptomyces sp. NPDC002742 TaxID=3364663 RepID=UPI0036C30943